MTPTQQRSHYLPAPERRRRTVEAVVELAGKQDPARITTTMIAKFMRVTQGSLFRHFANKDAIWSSVMEWVAEALTERVEKAALEASSPLESLEAMFMSHIDFIARHPGVPRILFGELQQPRDTPALAIVGRVVARYRKRLEAIIEEGRRQGEVAAEVDSSAAAVLFVGTMQGLVVQSLLAGDPAGVRRDAPAVFAIYRRGIGAAR